METVTMQCGRCGQIMAISTEHLGSQVHCPHCQAIVQTEFDAPQQQQSPKLAEPEIGGLPEKTESDSIFSPPEPSDDLFGAGAPPPKIEIPEAARHDPLESAEPPWYDTPQEAVSTEAPKFEHAMEPADETAATLGAPRVQKKRSMLAANLLIFLVPYSLLATGVIVYLLFFQNKTSIHPLEFLPDHKPKEGARKVEQIKHDLPLPEHLKTRLAHSIRVGDLEVTPVKVHLTRAGNLVLHLKMRNLSRDTLFNPISDDFLDLPEKNAAKGGANYTFLDAGSNRRYYGSFADREGPPDIDDFAGDIGPGQEETIRITTYPLNPKTDKAELRRLANSPDPLLWRIQVRRGFVNVRGNSISATTVIGVSFNAREIAKEG